VLWPNRGSAHLAALPMISRGERWALRKHWVGREPRPTSLLLPACFQRGFKRMPAERCTLQALRKFLYAGESA
jgi:hypothetical protein